MSVTIEDISKEAQVSIATVSRALNGKDGVINFNTRQRILEIAKKLNYNLRGKKALANKNIGIISQFLFSGGVLKKRATGYYNILFGFIEKVLRYYGYNTFFSSYLSDEVKDEHILKSIKEKVISGLLIVGPVKEKYLKILQSYEIPFVLINYRIKGGNYNTVTADNFGGAYNLVNHLIKLGHKKIGFIREEIDDPNFNERFRGYLEALKDNKISYDKELVMEEPYNIEIGYKSTLKFLKRADAPTAIFGVNDYIGMNIIKAVKSLNLKIPEDISIIGFDAASDELGITPSITSAKVYEEELARIAVERLLSISRESFPPLQISISTPIVFGKSTGKVKRGY